MKASRAMSPTCVISERSHRKSGFSAAVLSILAGAWVLVEPAVGTETPQQVDAASLRGKIMCGYQGWFRCPGDPANMGWIHWSHTPDRISPQTLCFEMWPDMREYDPRERFAVPGFTYSNGSPP